MSLDPARRAGLERSRARSIARDHFDIDESTADVFAAPFGVAVTAGDGRVCIVASSDDLAVLGGLLVWLDRHRPETAAAVFEHHAGVHARRLRVLAPEVTPWSLDGSGVSAATPEPISAPRPVEGDVTALVALIERSGAQVVAEDGLVRAEVEGLEVARIVYGEAGPVLEVGVGRFDREAGALLHAERSVESSLEGVIEQVRPHRRPGAAPHAVGRLGRERWLREVIRRRPDLAGVTDPRLVEPVPPRRSLLEVGPAALVGHDGSDTVLVVCSVGADLGLVPATADLVAVHQPDEVRFVLPGRDHLPHLDRLIGRLGRPASLLAVDPPWQG